MYCRVILITLVLLTGVFAVVNMVVLAVAGFGAWVGYTYFTKDLPSVDNIQTIEFEATPGAVLTAPPLLGEHTDAVLAELGIDADQLERLRAQGVV